MLKELSSAISMQIDQLVEEIQRAFEKNIPTYAGLSGDARREIRDLVVELARRAAGSMAGEGVDSEELYAFARVVGRNRSLQSMPFGDLVRAVYLLENLIWKRVAPQIFQGNMMPRDWGRILDLQNDLNANLFAALSASYLETKDELISRQLNELHGLLEVGMTIVSTRDLDRVFLQILEVAGGIMQVPMGAVYLFEGEEGGLRLVSQMGLNLPGPKGRSVDPERLLLSRAIREGAPVTASGEDLRGLILPVPAQGGKIRSAISCPIMKDDRPMGGLELYDVELRSYNRLDLALLAAFAPQAGVAIENARLFELERRRRRQTVELKELAEAIAGAMSFKQAMGILVRSLVLITGADRCLLFFYDQESGRLEFARGFGLTSAMTRNLQGRTWSTEELDEATRRAIMQREIVSTDDAQGDPRINEEYARFLKMRTCMIAPLVYGGKVSGVLTIGSNTRTRLFDAEDREMMGVILDQVTIAIEQVRLRERIRERERRLQELEASEMVFRERERSEAIIAANPDAIFLVDRERNITLFNPAARVLLGWKEEEAIGRNVHEILYGADAEPGECPVEECPVDATFRGEKVAQNEMEYCRPDGGKVWIGGSFSAIRNKKRQIESVVCVFRDITEQKRLQHLALVDKELDIASNIQRALLPEEVLENPEVKVVAHQEQARIVGGDWYDYWEQNGRLTLVIGDAAGSGIPAALLATLGMSAIRAEARYRTDIMDVLLKANRAVMPHHTEDRFITAFYVEVDLETLEMRYVNAGHNDPVLIRGGTDLVVLGSGKRSILGVFEHPDLGVEHVQLEPGDRLFLYTDGVIDCRDSRRRHFGEKRLRRYLRRAGSLAPDAFVQGLVSTLNEFCGGDKEDDFTLLVCDVKAAKSPGRRG